jgi:hypothetical protein
MAVNCIGNPMTAGVRIGPFWSVLIMARNLANYNFMANNVFLWRKKLTFGEKKD